MQSFNIICIRSRRRRWLLKNWDANTGLRSADIEARLWKWKGYRLGEGDWCEMVMRRSDVAPTKKDDSLVVIYKRKRRVSSSVSTVNIVVCECGDTNRSPLAPYRWNWYGIRLSTSYTFIPSTYPSQILYIQSYTCILYTITHTRLRHVRIITIS